MRAEPVFHICKATRAYEGIPYSGSTSGGQPAVFRGYDNACRAAMAFNERNPVGWVVYEASARKRIFSTEEGTY